MAASERNLDVLLVSALTEEQQVVHSVLKRKARFVGTYGTIPNRVTLYEVEHGYLIASACMHDMGAKEMSSFLTRLLGSGLRPACAVLVGIAATIKGDDVRLADVFVASQVFSADDIKVDAEGLTFRTKGYQTDVRLGAAAGSIRESGEHHIRWRADCLAMFPEVIKELNESGLRPTSIVAPSDIPNPRLVTEAGAGGPFLIADEAFGTKLRSGGNGVAQLQPKLAWAEMEAHGFMHAAHSGEVPAAVIKGISDGGDAQKQELERETGGFFRVLACSNAVIALLHLLQQYPRAPASADDRIVSTTDKGSTSAEYRRSLIEKLQHFIPLGATSAVELERIYVDLAIYAQFKSPYYRTRDELMRELEHRTTALLDAADVATQGVARALATSIADSGDLYAMGFGDGDLLNRMRALTGLDKLAELLAETVAKRAAHDILYKWRAGESDASDLQILLQASIQRELQRARVQADATPAIIEEFRTRLNDAIRRFEEQRQRIPFSTAVSDHRRIVVMGHPGSGKSTLLRREALVLAKKPMHATPILFELKRLNVVADAVSRESLIRIIEAEVGFSIEDALRVGPVWFFLDGLDEIKSHLRADASGAIVDLSNRFRSSPFVVSCRILGYEDALPEFRLLELVPGHSGSDRFMQQP